MVDRNQSLVSSAKEELAKKYPGTTFAAYGFDLAHLANVKAMLDKTIKEFGGYDVLCNVAAITIGDIEFVDAMNNNLEAFEKWKLMHDVNTTSLSFACQLAIGHFKSTGKRGAIVNVGRWV
jgi:NAD(P)-dependent dehydrogenase (short-subunit alcohol dehydrogenase family)